MSRRPPQRETNPFPFSDSNKRYHTYDYYLRHTFGTKCAKIPLDGGFTCPNRDGRCGVGGGAVTARVDGKHTVLSLTIKPEVIDPEDAEMLADLITAAVNEAIRKAIAESEAEMSKLTGGMSMPGMPGMF